jgi:hypothetical protein
MGKINCKECKQEIKDKENFIEVIEKDKTKIYCKKCYEGFKWK